MGYVAEVGLGGNNMICKIFMVVYLILEPQFSVKQRIIKYFTTQSQADEFCKKDKGAKQLYCNVSEIELTDDWLERNTNRMIFTEIGNRK